MRILGIILIVAGILMFVFNGMNVQTEKKVADLGSIEINRRETKQIAWPVWLGGIVVVAGIALVVADRRKK